MNNIRVLHYNPNLKINFTSPYYYMLGLCFCFIFLTQSLHAQWANTYGNGYLGGSTIGNRGNDNVHLGVNAGMFSNASWNVSVGNNAGRNNQSKYNVFIGGEAGKNNSTATQSIAIGYQASYNNGSGYDTAIGYRAGYSSNGVFNVFLGNLSGRNASGSRNVLLGPLSGYNASGSDNIFIGYKAGENERGSDLLYIDNSNTSSPLIWGDFHDNEVVINGDFDVQGAFTVNGSPISGGTSIWALDGNNVEYLDGHVAVGDNHNANDLTVWGDFEVKGNLTKNGIPVTSGAGGGTSLWSLNGGNLSYTAGNVDIGNGSNANDLKVWGDFDVVGNLTLNGNPLPTGGGSSLWVQNGSDISYTAGHVNIGADRADKNLKVWGDFETTENIKGKKLEIEDDIKGKKLEIKEDIKGKKLDIKESIKGKSLEIKEDGEIKGDLEVTGALTINGVNITPGDVTGVSLWSQSDSQISYGGVTIDDSEAVDPFGETNILGLTNIEKMMVIEKMGVGITQAEFDALAIGDVSFSGNLNVGKDTHASKTLKVNGYKLGGSLLKDDGTSQHDAVKNTEFHNTNYFNVAGAFGVEGVASFLGETNVAGLLTVEGGGALLGGYVIGSPEVLPTHLIGDIHIGTYDGWGGGLFSGATNLLGDFFGSLVPTTNKMSVHADAYHHGKFSVVPRDDVASDQRSIFEVDVAAADREVKVGSRFREARFNAHGDLVVRKHTTEDALVPGQFERFDMESAVLEVDVNSSTPKVSIGNPHESTLGLGPSGRADLIVHGNADILKVGTDEGGDLTVGNDLTVTNDVNVEGFTHLSGHLDVGEKDDDGNYLPDVGTITARSIFANRDIQAVGSFNDEGEHLEGGDIKANHDLSAGNDVFADNNITARGVFDITGTHIVGGDVKAAKNLVAGNPDIPDFLDDNGDPVMGNIIAENDIAIGRDADFRGLVTVGGNMIVGSDEPDILPDGRGSIRAEHEISAGGNVRGSENLFAGPVADVPLGQVGNVVAEQNVIALNNIQADNDITAGHNILATNDIIASNNIFVTNDISGYNIRARNDLDANNNITSNNGNIRAIAGNISALNGQVSANDLRATNNIIALNNITAAQNVQASLNLIAEGGIIGTGNILSRQGDIIASLGNLEAPNGIVIARNVTATEASLTALVSKKIAITPNPETFKWPDYVFNDSFNLMPLEELEHYVKQEQHLPEVPSGADIAENGLDVANMDATLLKKIEELTLYTIQQNNQIKTQKAQLNEQQQQFKAQEVQLKAQELRLKRLEALLLKKQDD